MKNDRIYITSLLKLELFTDDKAREPVYTGNPPLIPSEEEAWNKRFQFMVF